jgi:hypothetical protein
MGRIVIYRNRAGVDMPAIVTQVIEQDKDDPDVHLTPFPPPGEAADPPDRQWGALYDASDDPLPQTWRWPERVG